jgi:hypothetical protein
MRTRFQLMQSSFHIIGQSGECHELVAGESEVAPRIQFDDCVPVDEKLPVGIVGISPICRVKQLLPLMRMTLSSRRDIDHCPVKDVDTLWVCLAAACFGTFPEDLSLSEMQDARCQKPFLDNPTSLDQWLVIEG